MIACVQRGKRSDRIECAPTIGRRTRAAIPDSLVCLHGFHAWVAWRLASQMSEELTGMEGSIKLPRMTTRRWMIGVAIVAMLIAS